MGALSRDGVLIFIDVLLGKQVARIQGKHTFQSFSISPDGELVSVHYKDQKHVVAVLCLADVLKKREKVKESEESFNQENSMQSVPINPPKKITINAPKTFFQLVESKEETTEFNKPRLVKFLSQFYAFPDQYRTLIWRYLLQLPENRASYEALAEKGLHPSHSGFRKKYPIKSDREARSMERYFYLILESSQVCLIGHQYSRISNHYLQWYSRL